MLTRRKAAIPARNANSVAAQTQEKKLTQGRRELRRSVQQVSVTEFHAVGLKQRKIAEALKGLRTCVARWGGWKQQDWARFLLQSMGAVDACLVTDTRDIFQAKDAGAGRQEVSSTRPIPMEIPITISGQRLMCHALVSSNSYPAIAVMFDLGMDRKILSV